VVPLSSPYVTRSQWGARSPNGSGNSLTGSGKGVALHWEGPEMGQRSHSECDNLMRSIQNYHMDTQGWTDIAYNLAVCEHGYIFEGRGKGKGSGANGTSDANHNYPSICALVGENDPQPAALDNGIADAVAKLRSWGVGSAMKGHRDFVSTACPGNSIYNKMKDGRYSGGSSGGGGGGALDVDGVLGPDTISEWQRIMGTPVDGVISTPTSKLTTAVQKHLNAKGMKDAEGDTLVVDGKGLGSNKPGRYPESGYRDTIEALQRYLGTPIDGYFGKPSTCIEALQKRLNTGKF
jgi:hypothetical protein